MSQLYNAFSTTQGRTANGGVTQTTSLNKCVDLFFQAGSSRGKDITDIVAQALAEDKDKALRIIQWMRDVRGGAGERQLFKDVLNYLAKVDIGSLLKILPKVPEIGRWDDYLAIEDDMARRVGYGYIKKALEEGNGLCAKWMPRKGPVAAELTKFMRLTPKQYRKTLVGQTHVVEQLMCGKRWEEIDFSKLPSLASARYQKAFQRNCTEAYNTYLSKLEKGEAKINAGAVYPYDITKSVQYGNAIAANAQWNSLPNYLAETEERVLPVVDVSGSMSCMAGGSKVVSCMQVAIGLGLYLSERGVGAFKDVFMTFSRNPQMYKLEGTLEQRLTALRRSPVGYNTDIARAFENLLGVATNNNIPVEEMPTMIVILSDMEFDNSQVSGNDVKAFDFVRQKYAETQYEMPKLVFWNLNARPGNSPVSFDQTGTCMVSGFSPAIMKGVLGGEDMSPEAVMNKTIMVPRYDI
jgi:hypothetical protein